MDSTFWPLIVAFIAVVILDVTSLRWGHNSRTGADPNQEW